ncbi:CocE/NonD family hydrolase [Nonomuraea sp. B10E15]|uniref:CocE/NonD family hydrolase n=2 Tax=unclassified Nonomuraea TaxID=2593643 RepID=UPI00325EEE5A
MERTNMALIFERVTVPLRDGVKVEGLLYRSQDEPRPTLLLRTPYGVDKTNMISVPEYLFFLKAGYNVAWMACRGTYGSDGDFRSIEDERDDGYDTVDWLVRQPWSDGRVATYGASYAGQTQWAIAASRHPAVKALAVEVSAADWYTGLWYHPGGAMFHQLALTWHFGMRMQEQVRAMASGGGDQTLVADLGAQLRSGPNTYDDVPLHQQSLVAGDERLQKILDNPENNDYWKALDRSRSFPDMTQPILMIAGWFDFFINGQIRDFARYRTTAATPQARRGTRIIIGPWAHWPLENNFPEVDFGMAATAQGADLIGEHLRHFAQWLPVGDAVSQPAAPVKIFVMGVNEWREEQDWPLPDTAYTDLYLDAAACGRDGSLRRSPAASRNSAEYDYDPKNPVPSRGGNYNGSYRTDGPVDQRHIEERADVLSFTTEPLTQNTEATGHVRATLFVHSSAPDTDFTAKLVDVHPDGSARHVCDGILRMRYRDGLETPTLINPGQVYEIEVDMSVTSMVFLAGHRIRIDISSSNFPRFDRNTNTGGFISREAVDDAVVAHNAILTGPDHPSRVTLPLIRR